MEYTTLGKTGLWVSKLVLGSMTYGGQVDEADAIRYTDIALDNGVNLIDTANSYNGGQSEVLVGKAVKGKRDKVILATKAGFKLGDGPNERGLSRRFVMEQVEQSLKRLDTDYIDIYFMHLPDHVTAIEDALATYTDLVRSGKVRYIGMSNFSAWQICEALWKSETRNLIAPTVTEMVLNPITRGLEQEFIPFVKAHQLGLFVYNPLAGGILSGRYKKGEAIPADSRYAKFKVYGPRYLSDTNYAAAEAISKLAGELDMTPVELCMSWAAYHEGVTSVIMGFSKEAQLLQNIKSIERGPLPKEALDTLDEIWKDISGNRFAYSR